MKFSGNGSFELCFARNWDLPLALFCREDGGQSALAVVCHSLVYTCEDDELTTHA